MTRGTVLGLAWAVAAMGLAPAPVAAQVGGSDPLAPLQPFLGVWSGSGTNSYGAYEFEARLERRDRWIVWTTDVFVPGTDDRIQSSVAVIGYDELGRLEEYVFEGSGVTVLAGRVERGAVVFERTTGDGRRVARMEPRGPRGVHASGLVDVRGGSRVTFESDWTRGLRPREGPSAGATRTPAAPGSGDPLDPLVFALGTWHGAGEGASGAFECETRNERRGTWFLSRTETFAPGGMVPTGLVTWLVGPGASGALEAHVFGPGGHVSLPREPGGSGAAFGSPDGREIAVAPLPAGRIRVRMEGLEATLRPGGR